MSKSLGNFFTIRDILAEHQREAVRYLLIASHYRSPINFSEGSLGEARQRLERFYQALQPYADVAPQPWAEAAASSWGQRYVAAMGDDFNTPEALAVLFELVRELNASSGEQARERAGILRALAGGLGLLEQGAEAILQAGAGLSCVAVADLCA